MAAVRYRRRRQGRDTYPMKIALVAVALLVVLFAALVWAVVDRDDGVRVAGVAPATPAEERQGSDARSPEGSVAPAPGRVLVPGPDATLPPAAQERTPRSSVIEAGASTPGVPQGSGAAPIVGVPDPPAGPPDTLTQPPATPRPEPTRAADDVRRGATIPRAAPVAAPAVARATYVTSAMVADALHGEGVYRLETGAYPEAVERLGRAVDMSPLHPVYRNNYGWALFRAGDVARAAAQLERSIQLGPARAIPYANLAEVRLAQGDTASALAAYLRFLELNDDPALERDANRRIADIRRR